MKKLIILLFLIPFIGFSQTFTWIKTDDISATRTDFIEFNDTIILKSGDTLWGLKYTTDTLFINDDTVLITGGVTPYGFYHTGGYTILVNSTDNVGIGEATPSEKLYVAGNIAIPETAATADTGVYMLGGSKIIHRYSSTYNALNFFVGIAGNFSNSGQQNNAFGYNSLGSLTTGDYNCTYGATSGTNNTTGYGNSFYGNNTGFQNTEGFRNTFSGMQTGYANTTGDYNSFHGYRSGQLITTGNNNTGTGALAGYMSTGSSSLFLGFSAGYDETTGTHLYLANGEDNGIYANSWLYGNSVYDLLVPNGDFYIKSVNDLKLSTNGTLAILENQVNNGDIEIRGFSAAAGIHAFYFDGTNNRVGIRESVPTVDFHVNGDSYFSGYVETAECLEIPTTATADTGVIKQNGTVIFSTKGTRNVFLGVSAGNVTLTGTDNAGYGHTSLNALTSGNGNLGLGTQSLKVNTEGTQNLAIGFQALYANTTGNYNTVIGSKAGYTNSTGSSNVFIGKQAGYNETGSNKLYIENSNSATPLIHGDFSTDILTVNGSLVNNGSVNYAADAQADDDYEIAIPTITALVAGLTVTFKANTANTDGVTLEITSVGDLDAILKMHDQALATGDIEVGQIVVCVFDGTNWQMTSQLAQ